MAPQSPPPGAGGGFIVGQRSGNDADFSTILPSTKRSVLCVMKCDTGLFFSCECVFPLSECQKNESNGTTGRWLIKNMSDLPHLPWVCQCVMEWQC